MRAQTLPAAAGWRWLIGGYALFRRNPLLLSLLVIAYWLTVALLLGNRAMRGDAPRMAGQIAARS